MHGILNGRISGGRAAWAKLRGRPISSTVLYDFQGVAYNGGVMFPEMTSVSRGPMDHSGVVLDLDGLLIPRQRLPVYDNHDDESRDGEIGYTTKVVIRRDYTLAVKGVLFGQNHRTQNLVSASGHRWQLSVGVDFGIDRINAGESIVVNGKRFRGPLVVAREGTLTDISFVTVGGDDLTWAVIEDHDSVDSLVAAIRRVGDDQTKRTAATVAAIRRLRDGRTCALGRGANS